MKPLRVVNLGRRPYAEVWDLQKRLVTRRIAAEIPDTLLLVEHDHVITVGRAARGAANVLDAGATPVVEIERGGDATYHGPGQLVAYPIVLLGEGERDLHRFLRNLEEAVILALGDLGIPGAKRRAGATGVWVGSRKIASIGVACRRWVTFHGLALNASTDLRYFARIRPCGFDAEVMTSLSELLGQPMGVDQVKQPLVQRLGETLGRAFLTPARSS